jgi:hypothetical protein
MFEIILLCALQEEDFQPFLFTFSLCDDIEETNVIQSLKKLEEEFLRRYLQKEQSIGTFLSSSFSPMSCFHLTKVRTFYYSQRVAAITIGYNQRIRLCKSLLSKNSIL